MPRIARLSLPGVPTHIVQRGNNRQACFFHPADYAFYLETVFSCAARYQVDIHAYVLMTNTYIFWQHLRRSGTCPA
jgi:putative transposase